MPSTTAQKLKIKEGYRLRTWHAPNDFAARLQPLPADVQISGAAKKADQLHWFVTTQAQMEEELPEVLGALIEGITCWIYYPKGSSGIQTDLTRDRGWEVLLKQPGLQWLSLIAFDETWSAFAMRRATEADKKREVKPKERAIFQYIDPAKKIVYLPEDFAEALEKAGTETAFFNALSFTNRKEYVEWIVSARRPETRQARVAQSIERLGKQWKNPANR